MENNTDSIIARLAIIRDDVKVHNLQIYFKVDSVIVSMKGGDFKYAVERLESLLSEFEYQEGSDWWEECYKVSNVARTQWFK